MKGFGGFPAGKHPYTPVPNLFFSEVLPAIDHLGELKLTLHVLWLLAQRRDEQPYVTRDELAADGRLVAGLPAPGMRPDEALDEALDRAVARGTLLRVLRGEGARQQALYFLNSERGRQAMDDLIAGRWAPRGGEEPVRLEAQRPNIFLLYENNVGPLTQLLSEQLMEAEKTYPAEWIEDAFREAVELNKRSWRYVQRILERWAAEGREDEASRRAREGDRRRYIEGKYADYIEH
ncbi:MAG TPA: DnaD domain protein [Anaerolineae bacterium]|nr:DnaD domain protein [Anaerolineae bacterium]